MEGLSQPVNGDVPEYQPIGICESDDSRSNASRSDDNDGVPGIIYTSDDSADIGQSDSTYVDSDAPQYYTQNVNETTEDQLSQRCLLASNSPTSVTNPFNAVSHPLSPMNINRSNVKTKDNRIPQNKNQLFVDHPKIKLKVNPGEGLSLARRNSTSSSSTEPEFTPEAPFLTEYEPLSCYPDDEGYEGGLNFEAMKDDPIKTQVIHEQLNLLTTVKQIKPSKVSGDRILVAGVYIDAAYKDAFYVKWNWKKIRKSCVFVNLSFLVALFCISVGMLVNMPQKCDPSREWWQGSVSYYIYVPSFQDSDGNGIGDLKGIINRLDYLQGLGVSTVRLGPIFEQENVLQNSYLPSNYSTVSKILGDEDDLQLLAALLHERKMFLTLDFPLVMGSQQTGFNDSDEKFPSPALDLVHETSSVPSPALDLVHETSSVLYKWTELGVDGFVFTDIHRLSHVEKLVEALRSWRTVLDRKNRRSHRRVMTVPVQLLQALEAKASPHLVYVLTHVDLIDVHLHINQTGEKIANDINKATSWDSRVNYPWINWNLGGIGYKRLSNLLPLIDSIHNFNQGKGDNVQYSPNLGATLFQLFLPGSVTLFYADELNAKDIEDPILKDASWASIMRWSPIVDNGGFTEGAPWFASLEDWSKWNVATMNHSLEPLRTMISASQNEVPLYIDGIFDDVGDYHPKKNYNYKIKLASEDLLIMDRFYPRRNKFTIVINLGSETIRKDLSQLYYGGSVLASSHGKVGYIRFQEIILKPGEALACVMDK